MTQRRDEAVSAAIAYASAALSTLVHLALLTREEDRESRERMASSLGDAILRREHRITKVGESANRTAEQEAQFAYTICRDADLNQLAWSLYTAATVDGVITALTEGAEDPDRVQRACRIGFDDSGKPAVPIREL
jgi:hypothetical protein